MLRAGADCHPSPVNPIWTIQQIPSDPFAMYIYIYIYNFGLTALLQVLPQELVIYINTFNTRHTSYYSHTNHYSDTSHCSHSSHRHYYNTKSEHYASTDYTCCGLFCSYVKWSHCTHEPESRLDRMTVPLGSRVQ